MGIEENKEVVRRFLEEMDNGNISIVDELTTSDFVMHRLSDADTDREAFKDFQQRVHDTFPNYKVTINKIISEGNLVSVLSTVSFIQKRHPVDVPLAENTVSVYTSYYFRNENNKIAEGWVLRNNLDYYQQHGVIPPTQEIESKLIF